LRFAYEAADFRRKRGREKEAVRKEMMMELLIADRADECGRVFRQSAISD